MAMNDLKGFFLTLKTKLTENKILPRGGSFAMDGK